MAKAKIGLVGLIHEEAEQDFWGTMQRVAEIGYRGIEAPDGLREGNVADNLKRFHDLGLQVLTVSAGREQLRDDLPKVIAEAKEMQSPRVSVWWAEMDNREGVMRDAELYNDTGAKLAAEGLKLCYHNHEHEFRHVFNGVYALDVLADHTDPKALSFELDIAWVTFGGQDPVAVLKRYAGRVPAIHVKDLYGVETRGEFTAVGTGVVKVTEAIQMAIETGVEWMVIEQDALRNLTAMETVTVSYLNLKEAGLV